MSIPIEPDQGQFNTNSAAPPSATSSRRGHIFASSELTWHGDKLCLGGKVLVVVVSDENYPGMWRLQAGVQLSDMVNLSRARDAARSAALALLNGGRYSGRRGAPDAICRRRGNPGRPETETRTSAAAPVSSRSAERGQP
jgi:hypothetical protein